MGGRQNLFLRRWMLIELVKELWWYRVAGRWRGRPGIVLQAKIKLVFGAFEFCCWAVATKGVRGYSDPLCVSPEGGKRSLMWLLIFHFQFLDMAELFDSLFSPSRLYRDKLRGKALAQVAAHVKLHFQLLIWLSRSVIQMPAILMAIRPEGILYLNEPFVCESGLIVDRII